VCNYLKAHPHANRINLSYDIIAGLSYLHYKNIVHADLKGVNVLVGDDRRAVLTDFGLSVALDEVHTRSAHTRSATPGTTQGTLRWMSPECLDGGTPNKASDVYSLGITIWEIFSGQIPFEDLRERVVYPAVVHKQQRPKRPPQLSNGGLWTLVEQCWAQEASSRPAASQVLASLRSFTTATADLPSAFTVQSTFLDDVDEPIASLQGSRYATALTSPLPVSSNPNPSVSSSAWNTMVKTHRPQWTRGNPSNYIDAVTFPRVLKDKPYQYRVVKGGADLGIRPSYEIQADDSQTVNLLEYNSGYGVSDRVPIKIFAVDPEDKGETLVAHWSA